MGSAGNTKPEARWLGRAVAVMFLVAQACVPSKKSADSGGNSRTSQDTSPLFTLSSVKVGSNSNPATDLSGTYYSTQSPLTLSGACRGGVSKVQIEITPDAQATTTETVDCNNTLYQWSKALTTETSYELVLKPLDASDTVIPSLPTITKDYVYDVTPPTAPSFLTPTTSTNYTVNNGQTSFVITGQVGTDVDQLIGPGPTFLALTPNGDGVHLDFSFNVTVPIGTTVNSTFIAFDKARNQASSMMSITSVLSTVIPVAVTTSGAGMFSGGHFIYSASQFHSTVEINSNVAWIQGAPATVGSNP